MRPSTSFVWKDNPFTSHDDLSRAFAEGFPVVTAVDGFDAEAGGEEEELKLAWEEDVHVELCQVAFVFAGLEIFLVGPGDVLYLFKLVVLARGVEQHGKFVIRSGEFVFEVDERGTVEGVTEVIDIGERDVNDEATIGRKVVVGVFEGIELLFNFVEVGK